MSSEQYEVLIKDLAECPSIGINKGTMTAYIDQVSKKAMVSKKHNVDGEPRGCARHEMMQNVFRTSVIVKKCLKKLLAKVV